MDTTLALEVLSTLMSPTNLVVMFLATALGIFIGAVPGLGVAMGIALLLPFSFGMDPVTGLLLLLGVYCGGTYGGAITAILINTPGTPSAALTAVDGYALMQKGQGSDALRMSIYASVIGGLISAVVLIVVATPISRAALRFGPPERFALILFAMTIIASVSGDSLVKGLMMGVIGMLVATVGLDPIEGTTRFSQGRPNLMAGFALVPILVGLLAVSELIRRVYDGGYAEKMVSADLVSKKLGSKKLLRSGKTIVKSSLIGVFIGSLPGIGAAIASFVAYNEAKRSSKSKEEFGNGSLEGIAAAEASNNGVTGATLIPLLTLGIPGDGATALMLGALTIHDLIPGPQLFINRPGVVFSIMFGLIVINIFMLFQGAIGGPLFGKVAGVPVKVLVPILVFLCFIGTFALNNSLFDVRMMVLFGIIGFALKRFGFPLVPMLLGAILAPMFELALRQSLLISQGSLAIFLTRPIALVFVILAVVSLSFGLFPVASKLIPGRK